MKYNTVVNRLYIKGHLKAVSPLIIGSGEDEYTNIDVIRDGVGQPFIPGTSLAGSLRHYLEDNLEKVNNKESNSLVLIMFGHKEKESTQSLLMVSDVLPVGNKLQKVTVRDGLKLDYSTKTVAKHEAKGEVSGGAKYDYEIIEPGATFDLKMEIITRENNQTEKDKIQAATAFLIKSLQDGDICIGAKTRRGFGRLRLEDIKILELDMKNLKDVEKWIAFDWDFQSNRTLENLSKNVIDIKKQHNVNISVPFSIPYSLLIRHYSTDPKEDDTTQLTANGKPVIPGTSWNGALLHGLNRILSYLGKGERFKDIKNGLFGYVDTDKKVACASRIQIEESIIEENESLSYTRNKIDRFTGGVVESALFSEKPVYGGNVILDMNIKDPKDWEIGLLLMVLKDISNGIQPVGGAANIGRGILSGESKEININNNPLTPEKEKTYFKFLHDFIKGGEIDG